MIDGYGGPAIENGVVLIVGERIVAVGPRSEVAVPSGTRVISTEGMRVCHDIRISWGDIPRQQGVVPLAVEFMALDA